MQTSNQEDVIEIDLQDLFGLLLHKAWIIILATLAAAAIGFAVSFFLITPQYESTTSIYISTSKGNENSMTYSDAQLASQLTKDYEELILGRTVLEKVIAQYQLEESYESLKQRVSVENTTNTRIISITVKDPNPQNAQIIANSIRDVAAVHIKDVILINYFASIGAAIASVTAETVIALTQLWIIRQELSIKKIFLSCKNYLLAGGIMLLFLKIIGREMQACILNTLILTFGGGAVYCLILFICRDDFFIENIKKILLKLRTLNRG